MKISVMGEQLSAEEIAAIPEVHPELEAYFTEPTVTEDAVNLASKYVPHQLWRDHGIHAWLTGRAKEAFSKMSVGAREHDIGRLRYVFDYQNDKPVLKTVILLPPIEKTTV